jgi:Fe2+ transport system protein FeoA
MCPPGPRGLLGSMIKASCSDESSALDNDTGVPVPLSRVPVGERRRVLAVEGPGRAELEREGLMADSVLTVLARTPLGGPLVVQLGRTRLALSVDVAAQVSTATSEPFPDGR